MFDSDKCVRQQIIYHINVFEEIICHAYMLSYNLYIKCGSEGQMAKQNTADDVTRKMIRHVSVDSRQKR